MKETTKHLMYKLRRLEFNLTRLHNGDCVDEREIKGFTLSLEETRILLKYLYMSCLKEDVYKLLTEKDDLLKSKIEVL